MVSRKQIKTYLQKEPKFDDIMCSLRATGSQPKGIIGETKKVVAIARRFNEEFTSSYAYELDRKMHQDPDHLAWDVVKKANEWGFYTMFMPKMFGGKGYSISAMGPFREEIGSGCIAIANLIGVHYLGFVGLASSWNMRLIDMICREVVNGEKTGNPCLMSFAMTEPDAGTDSQNVEFMDTGSLACHAKKVPGGYVVNGTKIFISCGHLSTWHILFAYTDLQKASENMVILAVKTGTKGFSFGKKEKKMGQKASIASELVFKDCFVPDDLVLLDRSQIEGFSRSPRDITELILANIWAASRVGVASFGTGVARGAFEQALEFASKTEVDGKLLVNHEWCQCMLAEMYRNVAVGRMAYNEGNYANGMDGAFKLLNLKPIYYLSKYTPVSVFDRIMKPLCGLSFTTWISRKIAFDFMGDAEIDRTDGWGSLAKFTATDMGLKNSRMAMEIMGESGVRHEQKAEKILRDSKLLQIYEGTNQINMVNVFKRLVARACPGSRCFSEDNI
ncbi:MAG: acyl-CoA dehydrogenase [Deltaproteobacteria bacterium]|nr:MAG: acyl-CoA dehydrogenase [Deltaproteobacteria bacterium]